MLQFSKHQYRYGFIVGITVLIASTILLPLVYFPISQYPTGHPWKVEFVLSLLLSVVFVFVLLFSKFPIQKPATTHAGVIWLIFPIVTFIVWSALSGFYANSGTSVFHHTSLWFCYFAFLIVAVLGIRNRQVFRTGVVSLSIVLGVICTICSVEYLASPFVGETFGFRYGRYAEIFATVLPFFFAYSLRFKGKHLVWSLSITVLLTVALLFSQSRASLVSALIGMSVLFLLRTFSRPKRSEIVKAFMAIALVALVAIGIMGLFSYQGKSSTVSRLTQNDAADPANSLSQNVRYMIWGVSFEMFERNRLIGVGADNFGTEFNNYRAFYVEKPENKFVALQGENTFPERAHNEFIQVFAELGMLGGIIFSILISGILILGIGEIIRNREKRSNLLTQAAFAGIIAFLCSSLFSSFSFRLMQNGLVFFFLAAILLRNQMFIPSKSTASANKTRVAKVFICFSIVACFSLTIHSGIRAASQYLTNAAENSKDFELAKSKFENAMWLDSSNASAQLSYGLRLQSEKRFIESSHYIKRAIENGMGTSSLYFLLAMSQSLGNDPIAARETLEKSLRLYPYSYFLHLRYALLLKNSDPEISQKHLSIAKEISPKQSKTWWIFLNEGAKIAFEKSKNNKDIAPFTDLIPNQAVNTIIFERQVLNPEEKISFGFNN